MCGRVFQTLPLKRLIELAGGKFNVSNQYFPSYNICPTNTLPAIRVTQQKQQQLQTQLSFLKWGFKTKFNFIINARIQQLSHKNVFKKIIKNRCVIILEGYYQWNKSKQPYAFKRNDQDHILVAGLYTDMQQIVILTKQATSNIKQVHHRMPAILNDQQSKLWLDPKNDNQIYNIIEKCLDTKEGIWKNIQFYKLAPHVNKINQKTVKCLMSLQEYIRQLDKHGIMKYFTKNSKKQKEDQKDQTLFTDNWTDNKWQNKQQKKGKRYFFKNE